jgi:hypothetical protein
MGKPGGPRNIDWTAARTEYVTGKESYRQIGERLGVGKTAVEAHALDRSANDGQTWGELRAQHREQTAGKAVQRAGDAVADRLARVRSKAAEAAEKALDEVLKRIDAGGSLRKVIKDGVEVPGLEVLEPIADKDLIAAAKLAIAVKVQVAGDPDGTPLVISKRLDELSVEQLQKLAGEK